MTEDSLSTKDLFQILEDRRVEEEHRTVRLHERMDSLKDELYEEIEKSHKEIMYEIRDMRQEMKRHTDEECEMLDKLDQRVAEIEKWRWFVIGGAAAVAFLVFGGIERLMDFFSLQLK